MEGTIEAPPQAARVKAAAPTEAAFEALYRTSRDDVFAYLAGLLRDRSAAEEITAQAFERAWRKRASFDAGRGNRRAWLFGIARNAALDELRRRSRQAEMVAEPNDEFAADPASAADGIELRLALKTAIGGLEPRQRELIALKFFAGLGNGEIAEVLGVSESNVGTRIHRTITKLRRSCNEA